jgi:AraC-like DNA-binding protein
MSSISSAPKLLAFYDLRLEPGWHLPVHVHESHHEMIFLRSGEICVETQGAEFVGRASRAIIYPQGIPHLESNRLSEPIQMYCLAWNGPAAPAWPLYRNDDHGRIQSVLTWMHDLTLSQGIHGQQELDTLLDAALIAYSDRQAPQEDERILAVRAYVGAHLADRISLDDLARAAFLSRFHFAAFFRAHVGAAPMEWLRRLRVEAAKTLLLTTALPVGVVGMRVGLGSESHFSRVFRRVTGRSPSQFRQES